MLAIAVPASAASPPLAGGWSEVAPADAELRAVALFAASKMPRRHPGLARVIGGERQVVAGTNWRVELVLTDHSRWRAVVWHRLDGSYELTRFERVRAERPWRVRPAAARSR